MPIRTVNKYAFANAKLGVAFCKSCLKLKKEIVEISFTIKMCKNMKTETKTLLSLKKGDIVLFTRSSSGKLKHFQEGATNIVEMTVAEVKLALWQNDGLYAKVKYVDFEEELDELTSYYGENAMKPVIVKIE